MLVKWEQHLPWDCWSWLSNRNWFPSCRALRIKTDAWYTTQAHSVVTQMEKEHSPCGELTSKLLQADFSMENSVLLLLTMPLSPKNILILKIIGLTAMTPLWHSQVSLIQPLSKVHNPVETNMKLKGGRNINISKVERTSPKVYLVTTKTNKQTNHQTTKKLLSWKNPEYGVKEKNMNMRAHTLTQ